MLAFVAAAKALKGQAAWQKYFEELGLRMHKRSVYRALELREKPADETAPEDPDQREWVWETAEADAAKLGLDQVVAWLPNSSAPGTREDQASLLEALRATPGIVCIEECFDDTVIVKALTSNPLSKRRLHSQLQELCPSFLWAEIRQVDHEQPAKGWARVAREVAAVEGRLKEPLPAAEAVPAD